MNKKNFVVFSLCLCSWWSLPGNSEDLLDTYKLALENDPTYRAAEMTLMSARESKGLARANYLPRIDVDANAAYNHTEVSETINESGSVESRSESMGISISQPIYNRSFPIISRQTNAFISQNEAQFTAAAQDLIVRVTDAYMRVLAAMDNLRFRKAEEESTGRQLEQNKQRFEVGLVAITDVHEAQARYDSARANTIRAENEVENANENLRTLTGQYPKELAILSDKTPFVARPDPDNIDAWTDIALNNNYSLIAAEQAVEQSQENVKLQRADYFPRVGLSAGYNRNHNDNPISINTLEYSNNANVFLGLDWNLYTGGRTSTSVRQASYDLNQAKDNYEFSRRNVQFSVRSAYLGVIRGVSEVQARKQAVISNESSLKASEAGFEVGTRTTVDVLNARSLLFRAINDYALARYDYILQWVELLRAAGTLDEEILQRINKWLEMAPVDADIKIPGIPTDPNAQNP